jgi:uncharacterized protein YuzE
MVRHAQGSDPWSSYDAEADTLCLNFKKPSRATGSEITDDVIIRYEGQEIVGLTILHPIHRSIPAAPTE